MKSGPHLPQLEKALAQKRRPNTAKNKLKKKKNWMDREILVKKKTFCKDPKEVRLRVFQVGDTGAKTLRWCLSGC